MGVDEAEGVRQISCRVKGARRGGQIQAVDDLVTDERCNI